MASGNGSAIYWLTPNSGAGANFNTSLNLKASSVSTGNRFWNCHRGVEGKNIYEFNIENAIFRSTQIPDYGGFSPGHTGILLNTNRFQYYMRYNEFSNLKTCINIPLAPGATTLAQTSSVSPAWGIYGSQINIADNIFSPLPPGSINSIGTNYINQAVYISCPNIAPWKFAPNYTGPSTTGIFVHNNLMNSVFRGVYINGIANAGNPFVNTINNNTITLIDDNDINLANQRGIEIVSNNGVHSVSKNFITGSGTTTNNVQSLVYSSMNSGINSPSVNCNVLKDFSQGFEFNMNNNQASWMGNEMTNLGRGLTLSGGGINMGTQGSLYLAHANKWLGTWTGSNFETFVILGSTASSSGLWINSISSTPLNNGGTANPADLYGATGTTSVSLYGDYDCYGTVNSKVIPIPTESDSTNLSYIISLNLYRYLSLDDSVRNDDATYSDFYNGFDGSSTDLFQQIEESLYYGDLTTAASLNNAISTSNTIETNYKNYYVLYNTYADNDFNNVVSAESALIDLCSLCPETNGACVYQARALYNAVYKSSPIFVDNCLDAGERHAKLDDTIIEKSWAAKIFPNPANNILNITSSKKSELLYVEIRDISGRLLLTQNVKTINFIATIELRLIEGIYMISVNNDAIGNTIKKLIISK